MCEGRGIGRRLIGCAVLGTGLLLHWIAQKSGEASDD